MDLIEKDEGGSYESAGEVNFELYHGTRDPKNPVYKKAGKGKYVLLWKS